MNPMRRASCRPLTEGERSNLSRGLIAALDEAGVEPQIVARPSMFAHAVRLWRGRVPIMALGRRIYWPGAAEDFSGQPRAMAVLQHELQHLLDFGTGSLTRLGYVCRPRNWRYGYVVGPCSWDRLGAEQRASLAEHLWLAERGHAHVENLDFYRRSIPWAQG